jgi:hypothetical protein
MARIIAGVLLTILSSPALAAGGGWEDMPLHFKIIMVLTFGLLFGLPSIGIGFFLQGFLRFRNAGILLVLAAFALLAWLAAAYGVEKTLRVLPLLTMMSLLFSPLFGLGWYLGVRDAKRRTTRRKLA